MRPFIRTVFVLMLTLSILSLVACGQADGRAAIAQQGGDASEVGEFCDRVVVAKRARDGELLHAPSASLLVYANRVSLSMYQAFEPIPSDLKEDIAVVNAHLTRLAAGEMLSSGDAKRYDDSSQAVVDYLRLHCGLNYSQGEIS